MKRILLSIGSILFVSALLAGGTGAFLADSGTSTGNTFASGLVKLEVDNESYATDQWGKLYLSTTTSWSLSNLAGKLFYNFLDIKPGDRGEDTVSVHVNNNNAWACMNINETSALTASTTPLLSNLYFVFWADDGDNVYESGEKVFKQGYAKDIFKGKNWTLADSHSNVWGGNGPLLGDTTQYIGESWCFGTSTPNPVSQDGKGKVGNNGPLVRGTGFMCDGSQVGNSAQGNTINADVSFNVVQSRNNDTYLCDPNDGGGNPPPPTTSTLFTDNFNSCSVGYEFSHNNEPNWVQVGGVMGADDSGSHGKVADLNGGFGGHTESITSVPINTTGYHTIAFSYDRKVTTAPSPLNAVTLTVAYSTDGGSTWTTLETVNAASPWTNKTWSLSPAADNKASVKVRFTFTGASPQSHAFIDNVSVTGVTP